MAYALVCRVAIRTSGSGFKRIRGGGRTSRRGGWSNFNPGQVRYNFQGTGTYLLFYTGRTYQANNGFLKHRLVDSRQGCVPGVQPSARPMPTCAGAGEPQGLQWRRQQGVGPMLVLERCMPACHSQFDRVDVCATGTSLVPTEW